MNVIARGQGRLNGANLRQHLAPDSGSRRRTLDLRRATFVDPSGLVALAAIAQRAQAERRRIDFVPPADSDCASYLSRMRLGQYLSQIGVAHELPPVRENSLGDRLNELRWFESEDEFEEMAGTVMRTFATDHPELARSLYRAVHEIGVNVIEHSGRSGGFLALQQYPQRRAVAFAIADGGIGLRSRLSQRMTIPDDATAIIRAAQEHVTTVDSRGRGRGIGRVIAITGKHSGEVLIISGTSQGTFTRGHIDPRVGNLPASFEGTLVQARLGL